MSKLIPVESYGGQQFLNEETAPLVAALIADGRKAGFEAPLLAVASGHRSFARQSVLWEASDKTGNTVAAPGSSHHNSADAGDMWLGPGTTDTRESPRLTKLPVALWLRDNAPKHGLVHYNWELEPWHVARIGAPKGTEAITRAALALEPAARPTGMTRTSWGWTRAGWVVVPLLLVAAYVVAERA